MPRTGRAARLDDAVDLLTRYHGWVRFSSALATVVLVATLACTDKSVPTGGTVTGLATVRSVDLAILESFPVQVHAMTEGFLADPCTSLDQITQSRDGERISVKMTTTRDADAVCIAVIVDFEEVVPLDVYGLPAGTYTVDVNGVTATFTLTVDNELN